MVRDEVSKKGDKVKSRIFNTAKKIQDKIIFVSDTEYDEFYNIKFNEDSDKDIQVNLGMGIRGGVKFNCTCKFHSVSNPHMTLLCSYVMAVLMFRSKK